MHFRRQGETSSVCWLLSCHPEGSGVKLRSPGLDASTSTHCAIVPAPKWDFYGSVCSCPAHALCLDSFTIKQPKSARKARLHSVRWFSCVLHLFPVTHWLDLTCVLHCYREQTSSPKKLNGTCGTELAHYTRWQIPGASKLAFYQVQGGPPPAAEHHFHSPHCFYHKAESIPASQLGTFQDSNSRLPGPFKLRLKIRNSVIPLGLFSWGGRMLFLFQWKESAPRKTFIPTRWKTCPITVAGKLMAITSFLFGDTVQLWIFFSYLNDLLWWFKNFD